MERENDHPDGDDLSRAEEMLKQGDLGGAKAVLDAVEEDSARKYFLLGKLFAEKKWWNEARKALEKALELDPKNTEYAETYEKLKGDSASGEMKEVKRKKFDYDGCAECCCVGGCELCGTGVCELLCNGCG